MNDRTLQPANSRKATATVFLPAVIIVTAFILLYVLDPVRSSLLPPCLFYSLTGFYCPGCGSTRALHALLHGQFIGAMTLNSLVVLCIPTVILASFIPRWLSQRHTLLIALIILISYGVLRNIPTWPMTLLAPH